MSMQKAMIGCSGMKDYIGRPPFIEFNENVKFIDKIFTPFTVKDIKNNVSTVLEEVKDVDTEVAVDKNNTTKISESLHITFKEDTVSWLTAIKIKNTKDNSKVEILGYTLDTYSIYKISTLVTTYLQYVNYYNRLLDVVNFRPPAIDHLNSLHKDNVLMAIDKTEKSLDAMRLEITVLGDEVVEMIKSKIDSGEIVIGTKTIKNYIGMLTSIFRIASGNKFEVKKNREKL